MTASHRLIGIVGTAVVYIGLSSGLGIGSQGQVTQPEGVVIPPTATTLEGIPSVRVDVSEERTTRQLLDSAEAIVNQLTVRVIDGKLYWASRQNELLQLNLANEFTYLSSKPGQYIRMRKLNDRISYVEHIDQESGSVTYFGELRIVLSR